MSTDGLCSIFTILFGGEDTDGLCSIFPILFGGEDMIGGSAQQTGRRPTAGENTSLLARVDSITPLVAKRFMGICGLCLATGA